MFYVLISLITLGIIWNIWKKDDPKPTKSKGSAPAADLPEKPKTPKEK